jgi:hypothetical protein
MAKKEQIDKAIEAVQKHIDQIINQYATTGPGAAQPDYTPLIQAIKARDLLRREA